jgi:O-antigen ligase
MFEIFAGGMSYLLLIVLLFNIQQLKFDRVNFLALIFCVYVLASIVWGSSIQMIVRVVLPFILLFAVRIFVKDQKHVNALLVALSIGHILPLLISVISIVLGTSIDRTDFYSGVVRYSGAFRGPHPFAYAMLNFMFLYCLLIQNKITSSIVTKVSMHILLISSFVGLYMSGTRTALVGCALFWMVYSFSYGKRWRYAIFILCGIIAITMSQDIQKIFWKTEDRDLNIATSGRIEVWEHNTEVFKKSSLQEQIYGHGIGKTLGLTDSKTQVWSSHNDYLELLMGAGVLGLLLYLILLFNLMWDISICDLDRPNKLLFGAILVTISAMNFGSNTSIFRAENAQYFWFYMGLFYRVRELHYTDALDRQQILNSEPIRQI